MRRFLRAMMMTATCSVVALPLGAQTATGSATPIDVPSEPAASGVVGAPILGPQRDAAVAGVRVPAAHADYASLDGARPPVVKPGQRTRGTSMMILGTAAFVAGLLIGKDVGTVMAVGGAIVGLYGLYIYLP